MEVIALANREQTKAADFEEVIRKDQGLAARVLKLVNSPFFARRSAVTSIAQATVVLGLKSLKSLVLATKTSALLDRQLTPYGMDAGGSWKHAIGTAALAKHIAKKSGFHGDEQEALFVAGLLHDVGKVILAPHISRVQREFDAALTHHGDSVVLAEEEIIGISHSEVGGRMAEKWQLDSALASLIRHHHDYEGSSRSKDLLVVQLANQFCNKIGLGLAKGGRPVSSVYGELFEVLAPDTDIDAFEREATGVLEEMQKVFQSLVVEEAARGPGRA